MGATANELVAFYDGERTRILIAVPARRSSTSWFAAAPRTTLAMRRRRVGAAATASSAAVGGLVPSSSSQERSLRVLIAGPRIATRPGTERLRLGRRADLVPRAMLIVSGTFGPGARGSRMRSSRWGRCRQSCQSGAAHLISGGFWAPDGAYSRYVSPAIGLVWVLVVSLFLTRSPATRAGW
jgi:hypothetical protein